VCATTIATGDCVHVQGGLVVVVGAVVVVGDTVTQLHGESKNKTLNSWP